MLKKWMNESKKNQKGLTLVELLAVVVILAIVAAIAFVLIGNVIENSKKDAHVANAQQIISAAKMYDSTIGMENKKVTLQTLQSEEHGLIGTMQSPWKKNEYDSINNSEDVIVTKDGDEFTISGFNVSEKCDMGNKTESELNKEGRKVCIKKKEK
ncbi:prepilin-type N-terminal cleavage/methylation domain-containing protein [Cerasibacillus terrae]|uniref:Prepilin-type N-terminal cleavage/methylation domain-containing protein n=1 Tax=Cerasibacillus terrae TaxID=2498845 RepID=A0A5C8NNK3_9BACI|nr:prepilin-type N-terminal cleavage/methylation domain-containing protein [Cerasibacillus terrae]TXL62475.1 prepilin-type N-terminal cleavage/methylation domain-containing protein [Cerasibacillus terrae]